MPVHNGRPYLSAAIRSLEQQTFPDFDVLVIDDASDDGSTAELAEWADRDQRVTVIRNDENRGLTACLNQGLSLARSPWIARHDADDISHPQRLELQAAALKKSPNLALLGTNAWMIDEKGRFRGLLNAPTGRDGALWSMIFYNPFIHGSVCFSLEKARALGGFDPSFRIAQDYELWSRLVPRGLADNLPERLVSYRLHAASVTAATQDSHRKFLLEKIAAQALRAAGLHDLADPASTALPENPGQEFSLTDWRTFDRRAQWLLYHFRKLHPKADLASAVALLNWKIAGGIHSALSPLRIQKILAVALHSPGLFCRLLADSYRGRALC